MSYASAEQPSSSDEAAGKTRVMPTSGSVVIKAMFNDHHTGFLRVEKKAAMLAGDKFNFVQASEGGVNIQSGIGKAIALQTMGNHGPFHMKMIWPMTMLSGPLAMPKDIPMPPFMPILPHMEDFQTAFACLGGLGVA